MSKQVVHTDAAPRAIGTYSQAVRCGNTVYLAGQIGLDPATMQMVTGIEAQIIRVFENLKAVAAAGGGGQLFHRTVPGARGGGHREPAARGAGGDRRDHGIAGLRIQDSGLRFRVWQKNGAPITRNEG